MSSEKGGDEEISMDRLKGESEDAAETRIPLKDNGDAGDTSTPAANKPPDGGWGWMIILGAVISQVRINREMGPFQ